MDVLKACSIGTPRCSDVYRCCPEDASELGLRRQAGADVPRGTEPARLCQAQARNDIRWAWRGRRRQGTYQQGGDGSPHPGRLILPPNLIVRLFCPNFFFVYHPRRFKKAIIMGR